MTNDINSLVTILVLILGVMITCRSCNDIPNV